MPKNSPAPSRAKDGIEDRLRRIEAENRDLRDALDALRAGLSGEVRTRRLVVEEEDGFERVVAEGHGTHGTVEVYARPVDRERATEGAAEGETASVALLGNDESIPPSASVYFLAGGDVLGSLDVKGTDETMAPHCSLTFDEPGELPSDERLSRLEEVVLRMEAAMKCIGAVASAATPDEPDDDER